MGPQELENQPLLKQIVEMCAKLGLLVASFFFSRTSQVRNNEKRLIASIAYQLALSIPATRSYIESALQTDPSIFDRSLDTQMETLIIWSQKKRICRCQSSQGETMAKAYHYRWSWWMSWSFDSMFYCLFFASQSHLSFSWSAVLSHTFELLSICWANPMHCLEQLIQSRCRYWGIYP